MSAQNTPYSIWRRQMGGTLWFPTSHGVKARTSGEAQSKVARMFANAGFSSMSLVAIPVGQNPNAKATGSTS